MDIIIKKATLENLKEIINLNQQLFDWDHQYDKTIDCEWPKKNEKYYKKSITDKDRLAIIAVINKEIVGYLIGALCEAEDFRKISKIAELQNMLVAPNNQGSGVGTLLCEKFFEWAKENKAERVKVITSAKNSKAIKFYQKLGFQDYDLVLEKEP